MRQTPLMETAFAQSDLHLSGCRGAQLQGKENDNTQKLYNQLFIIMIAERNNRKLSYFTCHDLDEILMLMKKWCCHVF